MGKRKNKLTDLSEFSNNRIVLLFSGGYDSTAILVNLIQSGCIPCKKYKEAKK